MRRTDFSYDLPPELIAQHPLPERSGSRLLFLDGPTGATSHHSFSEFPDFIGPDDLLVFNNTRVIPARLWGRKATGGKVEILIERFTGSHQALAQIRSSKSPKAGSIIELSPAEGAEPGPYRLTVTGRDDALFQISSESGVPLPDILREIGHMPLPPYIDRADEAADQERYQTVYAEREGAVAAPTAGLHFTREILQLLDARGVRRVAVTLRCGGGHLPAGAGRSRRGPRDARRYLEVDEAVLRSGARDPHPGWSRGGDRDYRRALYWRARR